MGQGVMLGFLQAPTGVHLPDVYVYGCRLTVGEHVLYEGPFPLHPLLNAFFMQMPSVEEFKMEVYPVGNSVRCN